MSTPRPMGEVTADNPLGLPPPPFPNALGRGPMIVGVTWTFAILALITVSARFWILTKPLQRLRWDDWLMLAAALLLLTFQACLTRSFHHGMGKRDANLTWTQTKNILKWTFISLAPLSAASILARLAICTTLVRLYHGKTIFTRLVIVLTALSVVGVCLVVVFAFASAAPVRALWDILIPAERWNPVISLYTAYTAGAIIAAADLLFVLWPVCLTYTSSLPAPQKTALILLLAMSLFTVAMAVMKTVYAQANPDAHGEVQYPASLSNLWSSLEASFVICMGSLPALWMGVVRREGNGDEDGDGRSGLVDGGAAEKVAGQGGCSDVDGEV